MTPQELSAAFDEAVSKEAFIEMLKGFILAKSDHATQPVDDVRWIPLEQVQANDYNPNLVAKNEMRLLTTSILHDGYTQPIVTIFDADLGKYVIVDGFHRHSVMRLNNEIREMTHGCVPIVVIDKSINDRMASTIRHNRARGKHAVNGVSNVVFKLLHGGWTDASICQELGLEVDELIRLKHVTGFSKLFENIEYNRAWETRRQAQLKADYLKEHALGD